MTRRVLLVDDDPDIRRIGALCLRQLAGWDVIEAESGDECLQRADAALDVILLDVMMPGMDGPKTLRALRADPFLCDVPVIFLTASVLPAEVQSYLDLGASGVIAKPFDPMGLSARVEAILGV